MYHPGTPDPDLAGTLILADGEERIGVDIGLQLVRTVAVEGRVSSSAGPLPAATQVTLTRLPARDGRDGRDPANMFVAPANSRPVNSSGDFQFTGVLPGRYRLVARGTAAAVVAQTGGTGSSSLPSVLPASGLWAIADITVGDVDITGLGLALQPALRFSGRVVFDARTMVPPTDLTAIRLRLIEVTGVSAVSPSAAVKPDAMFEIGGVLPGTYSVTSSSPDSGWLLRSVMAGGRDLLDFPLEIGTTGDVGGVVATFTDRRSELSGTLLGATNAAAPDHFVVVFAVDRSFWRPAARRVQFARPGNDGRFAIRDLPAGDYLIAALTDLEPGDLFDPLFLDALIPAAVPVHLDEGEKKTLNLRVAR
jgi:hypothetical protein